ncbi:MAG: hypothetical protein RL529_1214 [Actinomycetota bacterium]
MQIDVGQTGYYQESDNALPVCADVDGFGFCGVAGSNLFELPKGAARFETVNQSGLDESLILEASSLEVMFRDSANLSPARSWGRPGDELLGGGHYGQAEFGLKTFDSGPVGFEDSQRVHNNHTLSVVADAWVDEEHPNAQVNGSDRADQAGQLNPSASENSGHYGQKRHDASANSGVEADLGSNGVHDSIIPTKSSPAPKMREETK